MHNHDRENNILSYLYNMIKQYSTDNQKGSF